MIGWMRHVSHLMIFTGLLPSCLTLIGSEGCPGVDSDGDGWTTTGGDCDDSDPATNPGAAELCDARDNDCDEEIDEGLSTSWYRDADGDGYGDEADSIEACTRPDGYVDQGDDCNDEVAGMNPAAAEECDSLDNNCDGNADEGFTTRWYLDQDGDGYGAGEAVAACTQPDGHVDSGGDCHDADAAISPASSEICDGIDDDCDGAIDDGVAAGYDDQDGDGFGGAPTCSPTDATVSREGDCDDSSAGVHPGAEDLVGDSTDADCGGSDGPQPSVGLEASGYTLLQAALDAAASGDVVWVGPGTYLEHDLTFRGKALRLRSTDGAASTVVDADHLGAVMVFDSGEGTDSLVRGLTLKDGQRGVKVSGASPTLDALVITSNGSANNGGGLYLEDASPTLTRCSIKGNFLYGYHGAGLYMLRSSPVLDGCEINSNYVYTPIEYGDESSECYPDGTCESQSYIVRIGNGAGIYLDASSLTMRGCRLSGNQVLTASFDYEYDENTGEWHQHETRSGTDGGDGGAIYATGSSVDATGCTLQQNSAVNGGALYLEDSSAALRHCRLVRNSAVFTWSEMHGEAFGMCSWIYDSLIYGDGAGGGIRAHDSSVELWHTVLDSNSAGYGGAASVGGSSGSTREMVLSQSVLIRNSVSSRSDGYSDNSYRCSSDSGSQHTAAPYGGYGGGLYTSLGDSIRVTTSILAYNAGWNLYSTTQAAAVTYSDLYSFGTNANHNLTSLDTTNLVEEPGFLTYDDNGLPTTAHLAVNSVLKDAGDPSIADADGSRGDLGAYGGPGGDGWDLDGDGYHDYFWPGTLEDAPTDVDPADYDENDFDPTK